MAVAVADMDEGVRLTANAGGDFALPLGSILKVRGSELPQKISGASVLLPMAAAAVKDVADAQDAQRSRHPAPPRL